MTLRSRIVAIFLVAVMLPCLFLSYVGLKSINQEKLRQQQLVLQNLRGSLSLAVDRIESSIEDQARGFFSSLPAQTSSFKSDYFLSLQTLQHQHTFVEQVLLLDDHFQLVFPRTFPDHNTSLKGKNATFESKNKEHLQTGDSLEALGQFDDAIKKFQRGSLSKTSSYERLVFLARIARCEFKNNHFLGARQTYLKILAEDQQQFYGEEIPYVLIAYYQLVTICERIGSPGDVTNQLIDFYRMLLENFDHLERTQFAFYLEQVKMKLRDVSKSAQRLDVALLHKLKELENQIEVEEALGNLLKMELVPKIQEELSTARAPKNLRYSTVSIKDTVWHMVFQANGENSKSIWVVGCRIRNSILQVLVQKVFDQIHMSEEVKLALLKGEHEIVLPNGLSASRIVLTAPFASMQQFLQGYSIGIVATGENPIEAIYSKSLAIYYGLVCSIIVIIVMGIVLIFRDIAREQQLSRMKSEFIANVSHEIKTPIATIRNLAENLNEGWITDQTKYGEYFQLIARESERLSHLVENILDFSRIEAERKSYRLEPASVSDVVTKTIDRFRLLVDGQGVMLNSTIASNLPLVKIDPAAIGQALLNLLDNAVKYSEGEKLLEISAEAQEKDVVIKVSDQGRGINKSELQKIFEKFYRGESPDGKNTAGSGIGLTLVKEIIEAHGGRVEVESEIQKGSTFSLFIPINNE